MKIASITQTQQKSPTSTLCKNILGVTVTSLTLMCATQAHAGAWVPEKGNGYSKVGFQDYSADDFFGTNDDFDEFNGTNISYYGEHGLGNNLAVYGSVLYSDIDQSSLTEEPTSSSGFADVEIGLRYQWISDPFVLSTSLLVKLPYLYDEDDALPRGNGQEDIEARILFGKSLYPYGYIGAEFGYRLRTDAPSDEYRYLIEYGYSFNSNLYFRTKLDGIEAVGNADVNSDASIDNSNLLFVPEFDLGTLEITFGWNFGPETDKKKGRWGAEITYNNNIYGDNIIRGQGVQIGITRTY